MTCRSKLLLASTILIIFSCGRRPISGEGNGRLVYLNPNFQTHVASLRHADVEPIIKNVDHLVGNDWVGVDLQSNPQYDTAVQFYNARYNEGPQDYRLNFDLKIPTEVTLSGEVGPAKSASGFYEGSIQATDYRHSSACCLPDVTLGKAPFHKFQCLDVQPSTLEGKRVVFKNLQTSNGNFLVMNFATPLGEQFGPAIYFQDRKTVLNHVAPAHTQ